MGEGAAVAETNGGGAEGADVVMEGTGDEAKVEAAEGASPSSAAASPSLPPPGAATTTAEGSSAVER